MTRCSNGPQCVSISPHGTLRFVIPFPADQTETHSIIHEFKSVLENENIEKVGQNIKYDMMVLKWYGMEVKGKLFDTMLAHYLIDPDTRHGMDVLAENYLNYSPVPISDLIGEKKSEQMSMRTVPIEKIKEYAAEDADITLQLKQKFLPLLKEKEVEK